MGGATSMLGGGGSGFPTSGGMGGGQKQSPFDKWLGLINGPPAQGQPETIAALREAMAARPGAGLQTDPSGANFFAMPQLNGEYGGAFNNLLGAMLARGPEEKPPVAAATPAAGAGAAQAQAFQDFQNAGTGAYQSRLTAGDVRGQGMSDIAWRKAMEQALGNVDMEGMTDEQKAAFQDRYKGLKPPVAAAYISDRGGR